ncbi:putative ABC transport system permease protein [Cytobacillus horneckiae]|nr:FtsX-like permease family protein [Cytobacillus horneckiae]MBN6886052.1 FtsX-like permease family protein [Cytobacillus horneckiae]MEC1159165.1 FtsX-like permease family protein [Cytobacillus horneckiae]MED2940865.1 FtsX-like permease family protein [Cytobacillus horneckiae]
MLNIWLVSWRNLTKNKRRFFFTLIAVILGILLTTSMLVANNTVKDTFRYYEEIYAGDADYWILSKNYSFSEDEVEEIKQQSIVSDSLSVLDKQTLVEIDQPEAPAETSVRVTGVSDLESNLLKLPLTKGSLKGNGLIIPENAAKLWDKDIGDTVTFKGLGEIEVTGIVGFTSWLASPNNWEDAEGRSFRVMMDLATLQDWTNRDNQISYIRLQHKDRDNENWLSNYQELLQGTPLYVQPVVIDDLRNNDVEGLYSVFYLVSILSLFISGFIIFNMIYSSVIERKKEFSIMKSLGYTNFNVFKLVFIEVFLLSLLGTAIALPIGVLFADLFVEMLLGIFQDTMVYTLNWKSATILSGLIGLLFPIIISGIPMYIAFKTPIIYAMRNSNKNSRFRVRILRYLLGITFILLSFVDNYLGYIFLLFGVVLIYPAVIKALAKVLAALIEKILGYPGRLSVSNIKVNTNRNANTSAMLAISIAVVIFLGSALESIPSGFEKEIRQTFGGDIQVQFEEPVNEETINKINSYTEVESVEWFRETMVTWKTIENEFKEFYLMSTPSKNTEEYQLFEGQDNVTSNSILLGERAFDEWGGEVNDSITINTPSGTREYQVSGKVNTSQDGGYVGFISENEFKESFNWNDINTIMISVSDSGNPYELREKLNSDFATYISTITLVEDQIESSQSSFDGMNEVMQFLLIIVIALSSIGISNTLLMNTMERIGEIGTIRAIGFTTKQVRTMIIGEGLIVGIAGIIMGVLLGIFVIYLNSISNASAMHMPFIIPWSNIVLAITAGIFLSLIASIIPSYIAAKINLLSALKEN